VPAASSSPAASSPPVASGPTPAPGATSLAIAGACAASLKKEKYCFDAFVGPVSRSERPDGKTKFDAKGCLPPDKTTDSCLGVTDVLAGPVKEGKRCCYTVCRGPEQPCGRPFLGDDARRRTAPLTRAEGWSSAPFARGLGAAVDDPALAVRLRDEWLGDAAAEHASVASFARFALELMAVGAPSDIVADAQRAGLDEIEHARACYTLATAYDRAAGGAPAPPFAPGPLSLDGIRLRCGLAEIAAAAAEEACVGETFAALVAAESYAECMDAAPREVLARIAEDEARHAELGWRFAAWAAVAGGASVAAAVDAALARGIGDLRDLAPAPGEARTELRRTLRAAGRLDRAARREVAGRATRLIGDLRASILARISNGTPSSPSARSLGE